VKVMLIYPGHNSAMINMYYKFEILIKYSLQVTLISLKDPKEEIKFLPLRR